jgi:hypothetical protein
LEDAAREIRRRVLEGDWFVGGGQAICCQKINKAGSAFRDRPVSLLGVN